MLDSQTSATDCRIYIPMLQEHAISKIETIYIPSLQACLLPRESPNHFHCLKIGMGRFESVWNSCSSTSEDDPATYVSCTKCIDNLPDSQLVSQYATFARSHFPELMPSCNFKRWPEIL